MKLASYSFKSVNNYCIATQPEKNPLNVDKRRTVFDDTLMFNLSRRQLEKAAVKASKRDL